MFKKTILYGLILVSTLLFSCTSSRPAPTQAKQIQLSERLGKIKMTDLKGKSFTLLKHAGKPIFLNFWATWCRPCVSEMQSMEELYQQYKDEVIFLAVSTESLDKIQSFQQNQAFSFEFVRLDISYLDAYVVKLPTTMLINSEGQLVSEEEGFRIWTQPNNRKKVQALVKK